MLPDDDPSPVGDALRTLGARVATRLDGCDFELGAASGRYTLGEADDPPDEPSTHCRVAMPEGAIQLAMELRPQTDIEQRALDRGDAFDVELGDEAFDRAFVVEAAPVDVIRVLLDEATRVALLGLAPCRFALDAGELHLSKRGTLARADAVTRIVGLCVEVRDRVERLPLEMARHREPAGYRGEPLAESARPEDEARARREIEAVEDVRRLRRQVQGTKVGLLLLGLVVASTLLGGMLHC